MAKFRKEAKKMGYSDTFIEKLVKQGNDNIDKLEKYKAEQESKVN